MKRKKFDGLSEKTVGVIVLVCILALGAFALFLNKKGAKPTKEETAKLTETAEAEEESRARQLKEKKKKVEEFTKELEKKQRELEDSIKKKRIGNFKYAYVDDSNDEIWITRITPISEKDVSTLNIPAEIDGKKVLKLGDLSDKDRWYDANNLFGLTMTDDCDDDGEDLPAGTWLLVPEEAADKVAKIKKIIIPDTVKEITPNCFADIQDGKEINIPKGITENVVQLCDINWKKFSIAKDNKKYKVENGLLLSQDGKKAYCLVTTEKRITIPDGVEKIVGETFQVLDATQIYIPASVTEIQEDAFVSNHVVEFEISKRNKHYATAGNCIYNKKDGCLVVLVAKTDTVVIPKEVTCIKRVTVVSQEEVYGIVIPKSVKEIWSNCIEENPVVAEFKSKTPPVIHNEGDWFSQKICVPDGAKEAYAEAFQNLSDIREIRIDEN